MRSLTTPTVLFALAVATGCSGGISPLDQTVDFGAVHQAGEYEDSVVITSQLLVGQTLTAATLRDGEHFELVTALPLELDAEASYPLRFRFGTPEGVEGLLEDVATLTVESSIGTSTATVRLRADWKDGDLDGDGHVDEALGGTDCDDTDPTVFAGAEEVCDGVDTNCNGELQDVEADDDGDGFRRCGGDCDDSDPDRYPGAAELCDFLDNDCDGELGVDETDPDNDGYSACDGDCEPEVETVHPGGHAEMCDGYDTNCDGYVPEVEADCD